MRTGIGLVVLLLASASSVANGQTRSTCQWVGSVWTCNSSGGQGIDWSRASRPSTDAAESFARGMELGEQARRAKLERERLKLEQDRLQLERELLERRKLDAQKPGQTASGALPDYTAKWLEKARPRIGLYPDYAKVVFEGDVAITPSMIMLMSSSDYAADIAYYLGTHKAESLAIAQLPLLEAARALDAIESKVKTNAPSQQQTPPAEK